MQEDSNDTQERRRERRLRLRVGVRVEGLAPDGSLFEIDTKTFDVSPSGAGLELPWPLEAGDILGVTAPKLKFTARAVVRHCYEDRSTTNTIVGVEFLDGKKIPSVGWP